MPNNDHAPAAPAEARPLTAHERQLIAQRILNHEAGQDTGLTTRAVLYLRGYEARVAQLEATIAGLHQQQQDQDHLAETEKNQPQAPPTRGKNQ